MSSSFDAAYLRAIGLECMSKCPSCYIPEWMMHVEADFTGEPNRYGDVRRWRQAYAMMPPLVDCPVSWAEAVLALAQRFNEFCGLGFEFWVSNMVSNIDMHQGGQGFLPGSGDEWSKMCAIANRELGLT
jgi:hypothetical protein